MVAWFKELFSRKSSRAICDVERHLDYVFKNQSLLEQALSHKSYQNENPEKAHGNNERLEFLGDAVLDFVLSDQLMQKYPRDPEGSLSKKRASLVNEDALNDFAMKLQVDDHLKLGKGERKTGGDKNPRLLASAFEALIGAVYRDAGIDQTYKIVADLFAESLGDLGGHPDYESDYKTRLQEIVQRENHTTPHYQLVNESGPDHQKHFEVKVSVSGEVLAVGGGRSKKNAEQDAARKALEKVESRL